MTEGRKQQPQQEQQEQQPKDNLKAIGGIEVVCYPLDHDAMTSNKAKTVFNYEQLETLKDSVSCNGRYGVEVEYLGTTEVKHEWRIFGRAIDLIETTIKLASEYPTVDILLISYLMTELVAIDDVRRALNNADNITWDVFPTTSTVEAFQDFVISHDYVVIPRELECYIDYRRMMNDFIEIDVTQINSRTLVVDTNTLFMI